MKQHTVPVILAGVLMGISSGCPNISSEESERLQRSSEPPDNMIEMEEESVDEMDATNELPDDPVMEVLTAIEQEVYVLVNEERIAAGLPELFLDSQVRNVARFHSDDMAENSFFSHINLMGESHMERLDNADIFWICSAENIAYINGNCDTAAVAVEAWMNSPAHYENIMNSMVTHTGIGVTCNENGAYYLTQLFVCY